MSLTKEKLARLGLMNNPNLLMNGDFLNPVNQRGYATYINTGGAGTIDRWIMARGVVLVSANGIDYYWDGANGANGVMFQSIEEAMLNRYRGTQLTFSININGTIHSTTFSVPTTLSNGQVFHNVTITTGLTFEAMYYNTSTVVPLFRFALRTTRTSGSALRFKYAKLEPGSFATPQMPVDIAFEQPRCQRYVQYRSTNTVADVDLRPPMRASPTKTPVGSVYLYDSEIY